MAAWRAFLSLLLLGKGSWAARPAFPSLAAAGADPPFGTALLAGDLTPPRRGVRIPRSEGAAVQWWRVWILTPNSWGF